MLLKNVLKECLNDFEELTIIKDCYVHFSGNPDNFYSMDKIGNEYLNQNRNELLNSHVLIKQSIGGTKLFIFLD